MSDESWKTKFLRDLRNERKITAAQIELHKKLQYETVQKLAEIDAMLNKLGDEK